MAFLRGPRCEPFRTPFGPKTNPPSTASGSARNSLQPLRALGRFHLDQILRPCGLCIRCSRSLCCRAHLAGEPIQAGPALTAVSFVEQCYGQVIDGRTHTSGFRDPSASFRAGGSVNITRVFFRKLLNPSRSCDWALPITLRHFCRPHGSTGSSVVFRQQSLFRLQGGFSAKVKRISLQARPNSLPEFTIPLEGPWFLRKLRGCDVFVNPQKNRQDSTPKNFSACP